LTLAAFSHLLATWREGARDLSISRPFEPAYNAPSVAVEAAFSPAAGLYTDAERKRRDESPWTLVQGILAPIQFLVFAISLFLVVRFLVTGAGQGAAEISVLIKTLVLYAIMITGSIWEKVVFGKWLFARPFFWEDVFSMAVLALHTAYVLMLINGWGLAQQQMFVALAAYVTYVINAGQFLWKLRLARLQAAGA
jgi:3-vinyl bacteriochlorophyllide hydratase